MCEFHRDLREKIVSVSLDIIFVDNTFVFVMFKMKIPGDSVKFLLSGVGDFLKKVEHRKILKNKKIVRSS